MTFARATRMLVSLAGLAMAIQTEKAVTQRPVEKASHRSFSEKLLNRAMRRLESLWPGGNSTAMLAEIMGAIPPRDSGAELQAKLMKRYTSKEPFVFAAFGDSIAAGHDNIMNQSWPFELERLLKPTFQALGFDFEVRKRGAGGYGEMPFAAGCLSSRAGTGLDAVSWLWGLYQDSVCEGHHFLAEAAATDGRPVVFGFAEHGLNFDANYACASAEGNECKKERERVRRETLAYNDDAFTPPRAWKPNEWYLSEGFVSKAELAKFKQDSPSQVRVRPDLAPFEPMVWIQRTGVAAQFENEGGALYPININAATKYVINDPWYQVREKAFNMNWHPGPLGHTLIASAIAHYMLANMKLALTRDKLVGPTARVPRVMDPKRGPSADNPLVGKPISGTIDNPQCGTLRSLKCMTGMHQGIEENYIEHYVDGRASANSWAYTLSIQQVPGLQDQAGERWGQADERWVYRGTQSDGELKFKVEVGGNDQYVLVCGAPCCWQCKGYVGWVSSRTQQWWPDNDHPRQNASDLVFTVDGREVPNSELLALHDELFLPGTGKFCPDCKNPADVCQPVAKVSAGKHVVGARVSPRSRAARSEGGIEMIVEIMEIMVVGDAEAFSPHHVRSQRGVRA